MLQPGNKKGYLYEAALILLCLFPLVFFRVNNFHDWGDDFAQYLLQSKFLAGLIQQMPVADLAGYGPSVKGILFSVLLIPVTFFESQTLLAGKTFISLTLIASGLFTYRYFRISFGIVPSLLVTLFFAYNIHVIRLKDQILPDLLFTGIIMLILHEYSKRDLKKLPIMILLVLLTYGLRSAALAVILAMMVSEWPAKWSMTHPGYRKKMVLLAVSGMVVIHAAEYLTGSVDTTVAWYTAITLSQLSFATLADNWHAYYDAFCILFEQEIPAFWNLVLRWMIITGFLAGYLIRFFNQRGMAEYFLLFYVSMLVVYPYPGEPVRFLVPLIPLILFYLLSCVSMITKTPQFSVVVALLITISQVKTSWIEMNKVPVYATAAKPATLMFEQVRTQTLHSDTLATAKPWAMAYFTGRKTVHLSSEKALAGFVVLGLSPDEKKEYNHFSSYIPVYQNSGFSVLKRPG